MAKSLAQIDAEIKDAQAKQLAILDGAKAAERNLNAEELASLDALEATETELLAEKKLTADAADRAARVAARAAESANLSTVIGTQPSRLTTTSTAQLSNQREAFLSDPKRGFANHQEFLMLAMQAGSTGRLDDPRLKSLTVGSDEASTVSDPYGGFLLPSGFSPDLMSVAPEGDPTAGRTTAIPMTTQSIEIPARVDKTHTSSVTGGLQVYRRNETDTSTATRMEIEQIKLTATMLFGVAYATEELLARSPISFISLLQAGFSSEFAAKLLKEKLFGTGAGMMQGVTISPCVVDQAKEVGQAAVSIVKENIDKMRSRCWGYGNAIWLYNHDCLPALRSLSQAVGTGGSVVNYFSVDTNGMSTLDGRPAFASEFCKTIGTSGDLILGNWTQYLEGTLTGQNSAESIHVRFVNHERCFKFWLENDGKSWWTAALTPNQSATTLSPFVTLATRA
ncbi:MAG TPA: phage major capsid protein [Sedimentisphaerales bacterium]|nr:phage major capsid protein [Sedimentisphaerales bacterium]